MTKLTDPMGYAETCTYDLLGRMLTKTDRKGTIFAYAYDGLGRLLNTKNGATVLEEYTYTLIGGKRTENNSAVQTTNTYDSLGRLSVAADKNVATGVITTKTYGYDIGSNRTSAVITVGSVTTNSTTYTYDAMNRMKTVLEGGVLQCTYNYDANGNRSSLAYANGTTTEYTYNLANMVKTLANKIGATVLSSYTYAYQLDGNQVSKTDQAGKVTSYVYDGLGRLTSETEKTGATVTFSLAYAYDANNNRVSMTSNTGAVTTYAYDKNNRLTTETAAGVTSTYAYDNNGNTLTKTKSGAVAETYAYDLLNRMVSSTVSGVTATYKYRADGLRYSKTVSGVETAHIWDGSNIAGDIVGGVVKATYIRGIGLIGANDTRLSSAKLYYLFNGHGDVVQITSISGVVCTTYVYDAFGVERTAQTGGWEINPFRYCGEYFDVETGTVYLRARFYNPRLGRFVTEDPIREKSNSINFYTYANCNPIRFIDPSGHVIVIAPFDSDYYKYKLYDDDTSNMTNMTQKDYDDSVEQYNRAIEYLKTSKDGKALIEALENSDTIFYITFNKNGTGYFEYNYYNYNLTDSPIIGTQFISWDPTNGLVMTDGTSIMSAAVMLAHEMGHAGQFLSGNWYQDKWGGFRSKSVIDAQRKTRENNNVKTYETPIAKQLGEPTRANYDAWSDVQRMNNSTHYRTTETHPWWYYIPFWNWGKPSVISVTDHNAT